MWVYWIRPRGGCVYEGGENCVKYLKREWNRKKGRGNKDRKKGGRGQAGSRGGCLKKGVAGTPLQTMCT